MQAQPRPTITSGAQISPYLGDKPKKRPPIPIKRIGGRRAKSRKRDYFTSTLLMAASRAFMLAAVGLKLTKLATTLRLR